MNAASQRIRLQKFLSDAGVASRRHAEELIIEGRVLVNDQVVDALPAFVDPRRDKVIVNGVTVRPQRLEYYLVHKPKGVVCTHRDQAGRTRAVDLLPDLPVRLFPVGRLDVDSTGLLLMTNDGELAQRLTHPRYAIPKSYRVEVRGRVPTDLPAQLLQGVHLSEGRAQATEVELVHTASERSVLMITLREGRNRQVRRMLARLGHKVRTLKRVQIGPLSLRGLPVGAARRITPKELEALRHAVEAAESMARPTRRKRPSQPKQTGKRAPRTPSAPPASRGPGGTRPDSRRDSSKPKRRLIT